MSSVNINLHENGHIIRVRLDGEVSGEPIVRSNRRDDETSSYTFSQKLKCLWGLRYVLMFENAKLASSKQSTS